MTATVLDTNDAGTGRRLRGSWPRHPEHFLLAVHRFDLVRRGGFIVGARFTSGIHVADGVVRGRAHAVVVHPGGVVVARCVDVAGPSGFRSVSRMASRLTLAGKDPRPEATSPAFAEAALTLRGRLQWNGKEMLATLHAHPRGAGHEHLVTELRERLASLADAYAESMPTSVSLLLALSNTDTLPVLGDGCIARLSAPRRMPRMCRDVGAHALAKIAGPLGLGPDPRDDLACGDMPSLALDALHHEGVVPARHRPSLLALLATLDGKFGQPSAGFGEIPYVPGGPARVVTALRWLLDMPGNWRPATQREWQDYASLLGAVAYVRRLTSDPAEVARALPAGKGWGHLWAALERAAGSMPLRSALQDLDDPVRAFARQVAGPARLLAARDGEAAATTVVGMGGARGEAAGMPSRGLPETDLARAWTALGRGRSMRRVLEDSRRWHAEQGAMGAAMRRLPGEGVKAGDWAPGLPDASYGEVDLTVLTAEGELRDEGMHGYDPQGVAGLGHCVGSYAGTCRSGQSRIVSLSRVGPDGARTRLSTAQLCPTAGGARIQQHRGRGNADPCPEVWAALRSYVHDLKLGVLTIDASVFAPRDGAAAVTVDAGYAWWVPGNWEAVCALWSRYLPRPLRGLTPDALCVALDTAG